MRFPMVSVIIPIYNTECFLDECIASVIEQTYKNFEVILVNDGSTDKSYEKCLIYQSKNDFVKVISINNSGPSKARNCALEIAKGDLLYFADSDDKLEPFLLDKMVKKIVNDNSDIAICDYYIWGDSFVPVNYRIPYIMDKSEGLKLLSKRIIDDFLWNKMFKKELFNEIHFNEDLFVYEDMDVMHLLFDRMTRISYVNENLYYYRQRNESSINNLSFEKKLQYFLVQERRYDYLSSKHKELEKSLFHSLVVSLMSVYKYAVEHDEIDMVYNQLKVQYRKLKRRLDYNSLISLLFTISDLAFIEYGKRRWIHGAR